MPAEAAPSFLCVPELAERDSVLELPPEEHRYLFRVCRAREGEMVTATDGRGGRARLVVEGEGRTARVRVVEVGFDERSQGCWICCGAPDGSRADWLMEKLAEFGVERFQPLDTARGRWSGGARRKDRWERLVTAAVRQSRQVWRMEVADPVSLEDLAGLAPEDGRVLADAAGEWLPSGSASVSPFRVAVVGPAGGLTDSEHAGLVGAGWRPVRIAATILRSETAALAAAALWAAGRRLDRLRDPG